MTTLAVFRRGLPRDPDLEAPLCAHRQVLVIFLRIAAVAGGATNSVVVMHIILEGDARAFNLAVARETRILDGGVGVVFMLGFSANHRRRGDQDGDGQLGDGGENEQDRSNISLRDSHAISFQVRI